MNNEEQNLQNLEDALTKVSVKPDETWLTNAKHNLEVFIDNFNPTNMNTDTNTDNSSINFWNRHNLTLLASLTAVLVFFSIFGFLAYNEIFSDDIEPSQITDETTKKEILANVLKNNSVDSLESSNIQIKKETTTPQQNTIDNPQQTTKASTIESRLVPESDLNPNNPTQNPLADIIPLIPSEYSYRFTKTQYSDGPAADKCSYANSIYPNFVSEYYEFFSNTGGIYIKNISKNEKGLIDFAISRYDQNVSDRLIYKGGTYAVKIKYSNDHAYGPTSYPVISYPASYDGSASGQVDNLIARYFGYGAEVLGSVQEDAQKYYIVKRSYDSYYCDADKIIYLTWVNADTFQIKKFETYINDESTEENLVSRTKTTVETKNIEFSEVEKIFNFEYNVSVRELDSKNYPVGEGNEYEESVRTFIAENNILKLKVESFNIDYYYSPLAIKPSSDWAFYVDRSFYPETNQGNLNYEYHVYGIDTRNLPKTNFYSYMYKRKYYDIYSFASLNLNVYKNSEEESKILNYNFNKKKQKNLDEQNIEVTIKTLDGNIEKVSAKVYQYKDYNGYYTNVVSYPSSYGVAPVSYPTSYPVSYAQYGVWCDVGKCYNLQTVVVVEFEGYKYVINSYSSQWLNLNNLVLEEVE